MAAAEQHVEEYLFRWTSEGDAKVKSGADQLTGSLEKLTVAQDKNAASSDRGSAASDRAAQAKARQQTQQDKYQRQLDMEARALAQVQAAQDAAAASTGGLTASQLKAVDAYAAATKASNDNAAAAARAAQVAAQAAEQQVKAVNDTASAAKEAGSVFASAAKFALDHPFYTATAIAVGATALSRFAATAATSLASASASTSKYAADSMAAGSAAQKFGFVAADGLMLASRSAASAGTAISGFSEKAYSLAAVFSPTGGMISTLVRGLGALPAVLAASAIGLVGLGAAAFGGAAAISKAYDDLGKLTDLAARAEKLDVGAVFLKSFTDLGPAIHASTEEMQAAIQRASGFVQDRLGQQNQLVKAFADLQNGGYTGGAPLAAAKQLEAATTTEQRIKAAIAGMAELEARGQRLAALDLSDKVFGPAVTERLRTGQTTVEKISTELTRLSEKQLFTDADAKRALDLSRAIEDTKRAIDEALESTFNFSKLAMGLDSLWLSILKTVLAVAEAGTKAADSASQAIDDRRVAKVNEFQDTANRMETTDLPYLTSNGDTFAAEQMRQDILRLRDAAKQLQQSFSDLADAKIDKAVGDVGPPAHLVSEELARLTAEAANATSTIPGVAGALQGMGGAAATAAQQIASVAAGIRAIQGLNPDLSGALGFIDKVKQVNDTFAQTKTKILGDFDATGNGEEAAKRLNDLLTERKKTLQSITDQQSKGATDYVRSGELAQMNDLDRSLAGLGDNYSRVRKERETFYDTLAKQAATPEDAASIRQQGEAEIAKLDTARKSLEAKARADAAARGAKQAATPAGADAYDNAIQRSQDQVREFELQIQTAGKATEEVYKLTEANRLRRAAASAGRSDEEGIAQAIDDQASAYARARKASEDALEAQRRLQEGQRELANDLTSFVEDLTIGGQKMSEAFASLAKTLASSTLKALISGEGALAGVFGTAPTEKGQLGGLLGGKFNLSSLFGGSSDAAGSPLPGAQGPSLPSSSLFGSLFDTDKISGALGTGAETGIGKALSDALKPSKAGGGVLSSPLGQGLATVGAGAAIGYSSQSPLMGALGGGLAGLASGNPILAVAGAGAGLLGGLFGESEAKKQAKKAMQEKIQAMRDALTEARPQIEALDLSFTGGSLGNVGKTITDAQTQAAQAIKTASQGGDQALADKLMTDFQTYVARQVATFADGFNGTLAEVQAGFGTNGPFATAVSSVQALGDALKGFVTDAGRLSDPAAQQSARAAAVQGALASLDPTPTLSDTQTELARIQGTAAGLNQVLKDLGLSSDQAAAAISAGVDKALDQLRDKFNTSVQSKINTAEGKDYLNDAASLVTEVNGMNADAAAVGGDMNQVQTYFVAAAQKIVDSSQLTGSAFQELITQFPQLTGLVHDYSASLADSADALSAAADRASGFRDRLFAAQHNSDSLADALANYDRKAEEDRAAEVKAGGQALVDLEAAQAAERLNIVADYGQKTADRLKGYSDQIFAASIDTSTLSGSLAAFDHQAEQDRLDEVKAGGEGMVLLEQAQAAERGKIIQQFWQQAQDSFNQFADTVKKWLDNLTSGSSSPLSPQDRLSAAQAQYDQQLAAARGGDTTAAGSITTYAQSLLDASKAFYASSQAFQDTFSKVVGDLTNLPGQVGVGAFVKYADGGWVQGPGTGTSDSILARLSNGEFVMSATAADRYGPILEAMNDDQPMAVVTPTAGNSQSGAAMVAELRGLRGQVSALKAEVSALRGDVQDGTNVAEQGHLGTIAATKDVGAGIAKGNRDTSRRAVAANW